jgi:peptide/nickel transport system substrate-binding protein
MGKSISRRRFLRVVGGGSALVVLSGCGATAQPTQAPQPTSAPTAAVAPTPAGPKILRIRLYGDIQNTDPAFRISQNDDVVANCINEGLVRYGANSYDVVNQLVETIEQSEDGLTVTFKLKEGVQWHKGYGEVTTEDVKFSFERIADPELAAAYADDWATLDHVEVIDKYNGKIVLKEPFAPLWTTTLPVGSGNIVCKKYVEEVGLEKFATQPLGSGPYTFESWEPKQQIVLKANPEWHGGTPVWDEIHFLPIEDDKTAEVAIQAGELDFTRISLTSLDLFGADPNLKLLKQPALRYRWIGMNVEHPKLQDINVRQAIRYGIDVDSILAAGYLGKAERENALIAPGLVGYWEDAPVYQRDVAKAKEYMAKAGLTSLDLKIDLQDTTEYRAWAEIAQQNLAEIGINLTINPMDSATFWTIGAKEEADKLELFCNNYSMNPDPSWATMWFTCAQIDIWNWERWCSPEYDELHKKGLVTIDKAEREKIYIEMQQIWDAACKAIFITHGLSTYAYQPTVKPATTPHGMPQAELFLPA